VRISYLKQHLNLKERIAVRNGRTGLTVEFKESERLKLQPIIKTEQEKASKFQSLIEPCTVR
jgi:hypothetical protein